MPVPDIKTARSFIDEAIHALAVEAYRGNDADRMERVDDIQATIALDLERVDRAIGPSGTSIFAALAENVKQAMVALHGARAALND